MIVVDDGSEDATAARAGAAGADRVIVFDRNRGKGAAVRAGMLAATGDAVVFTDADLQYPPDRIVAVLGRLDGVTGAVVASASGPAMRGCGDWGHVLCRGWRRCWSCVTLPSIGGISGTPSAG